MSTLQQLKQVSIDLDRIYNVHPDKSVIDSMLQDIWFFQMFAGDKDHPENEAKLLLKECQEEYNKYYQLT